MGTEPRIISNQVYLQVQPITLKEEAIPNRVVLYANNFSGLNPVHVTDKDLEDLLGNTVGMAGNNVLVQLKKKFSTFKNGPWYIDSRDGILYIHNRKNPLSTVHDYTYNRENGELLSASFTIHEVYKPFAGLGAVVDALGKSLGKITEKLDDFLLPDSSEFPLAEDALDKYNKGFSISRTDTVDDVSRNNGYGPEWKFWKTQEGKLQSSWVGSKWEGDRLTRQYNAKSSAQKRAQEEEALRNAYLNTDRDAQLNYLLQIDPLLKQRWRLYMNSSKDFGENHAYTQNYKRDLIKAAEKYNVPGASVPFTDYSTKRWVATLAPFENTGPEAVQRASNQALKRFLRDNQVKRKLGDAKLIPGSEKLKTFKKYKAVYGSQVPKEVIMTTGTVVISYTGYGGYRTFTNGAKVVQDAIGRPLDGRKFGSFGNALGDVKKALHNAGKGKKEKQLLATIRVIGNPDIDISHNIGLYNVGKKYSGKWYVKKVTHTIEPGQGYICDIELQKQLPKLGASGKASLIDTKGSTVDNSKSSTTPVSAKDNNELRSKVKNTSVKRTNTTPTPKNNDATWQSYLDIPWTVEESAAVDAVIQNGKKAGMSDGEIRKLVGNMANNIARRRASEAKHPNSPKIAGYTANVVQGSNGRVVKVVSRGNFGIDPNVKVPKGKYTSNNFKAAMKRNNIKKK